MLTHDRGTWIITHQIFFLSIYEEGEINLARVFQKSLPKTKSGSK
jgi:hypothetical protein